MFSKRFLILLLTGAALVGRAEVVVFSSGFANGTAIPDGNLAGWADTRTLSGYSGTIADLNVSLNINGGLNGQIYGYLTHDSGFVVLLNRVGRSTPNPPGYADTGFNLTFDDSALSNVHSYQSIGYALSGGQLIGSWQPDGRYINPTSPTSAFDSAIVSTPLSNFNALDPNGSWTLFLADVVTGNQMTVQNWSMQWVAVPEPGVWTLVAMGGTAFLFRRRTGRR